MSACRARPGQFDLFAAPAAAITPVPVAMAAEEITPATAAQVAMPAAMPVLKITPESTPEVIIPPWEDSPADPAAAGVPPPEATVAVADGIPAPFPAWGDMLRNSPHGRDVTVMVVTQWTGQVLEVLRAGQAGRWLLFRDGRVEQIAADAGQVGRLIYKFPADAAALHATHPLVQIGPGTNWSASYRPATPGEVFCPPTWPIGGSRAA